MTTCFVEIRIPYEELKNARKVGVQLPDGLKRYAIEIVDELERRGYEVILSGESCYGACDVDVNLLNEVDVLLHFAHTPLLDLPRVVYVPYFIDYNPELDLDVPERRIALIATAQFCHLLGDVKKCLEERGYEVKLCRGKRVAYPGQVLGCNYSALRNCDADAVLFVGDGMFHAVGAAMYSGMKVYAYDPFARVLREVDAADFMKRRYFEISRCVGLRNAGVLVSSKPGQRRLSLAMKLVKKARNAEITAHVIYLNEITPEKILNLPYDFYINTACPRISYDDAANYSKPVITPSEFEALIGIRDSIEIDEIS